VGFWGFVQPSFNRGFYRMRAKLANPDLCSAFIVTYPKGVQV